MLHIDLTTHANQRLQQRGFRKADVNLILQSASQIGPMVYVLTERDAEQQIKQRKREILDLERLRGATLVIDGSRVITVYHARNEKMHKHSRKRQPQRPDY
jgi:hypothetical protein